MPDDRDWSWLPRSAAPPPPPIEHRVWTLTKGDRQARLDVRQHPLGQELRCDVDGSLVWTEVFKPGDGVRMGVVADEHRIAFEARGWVRAT